MPFIIVGVQDRETESASGEFYCPKCETLRPYKRKRRGRYLSLFFVPLIEVQKRGEYVECQVCGRAYTIAVL